MILVGTKQAHVSLLLPLFAVATSFSTISSFSSRAAPRFLFTEAVKKRRGVVGTTERSSFSQARQLRSTSVHLFRGGGGSSDAHHTFSFGRGGARHSSQNQRNRAKSSTSLPAADKPFETWTFDKPCETMAWTDFAGERVSLSYEVDASLEESDLIVLGVVAPAKEVEDEDDDGEEKEEEEEDESPEPVVLTGKAKELDEAVLGGLLSATAKNNYKSFKNGATLGAVTPVVSAMVGSGEDAKVQKFVLLGLGRLSKDDDKNKGDPTKITTAGSKLGSTLATQCNSGDASISSCTVLFPSSAASVLTNESGSDTTPLFANFASAFYTGLYADNRFKSKKSNMVFPAKSLAKLVVSSEDLDAADVESGLEQGTHLAAGVYLTKDIVNAPHNVLNSHSLANVARRVAEESGGCMSIKVLEKDECEALGMGSYLGVARGSETDPKFIHLTYTPPGGDVKRKVGLVGKGLLFDTGGYNIKTQMMEKMKFDCGGSAAVLGAARAVTRLKPEGVEAHFIVAACENMINEKAYVPSDILTASNGKTIEVLNTDAEGRLTLADALVYADKEVGCERIIELSTLTGACMISLGTKMAGVWTSNDDLATEIEAVSKATGDKSWRMPLESEYNEQLKSSFADIKNIGTRWGGAITAALFLQHFVRTKKVPFAHVDMAGPVWDDKIGATGYGARFVTEWVKRQGMDSKDEE